MVMKQRFSSAQWKQALPVNVDFSSCFSICNLVFSHLQDLKYLERQAFNRFSCLHQVLKKTFRFSLGYFLKT